MENLKKYTQKNILNNFIILKNIQNFGIFLIKKWLKIFILILLSTKNFI
jgi:hypothetical protein